MFAISCKRSLRFSPNFIARLGGEQTCIMKGGEEMPTEQKTRAQIYEAAKDELVRDIALLVNSEGATGEMLHDMLDAAMLLRNLSMRFKARARTDKE